MARRTLTITDQDKAEMLRMYVSDNKGIVDIGARFTISPSTVARILRAQGASMRKRGTRTNKDTEVVVNPLEDLQPMVVEEAPATLEAPATFSL